MIENRSYIIEITKIIKTIELQKLEPSELLEIYLPVLSNALSLL